MLYYMICKKWNKKQIASTLHETPMHGISFLNPMIFFRKNDSFQTDLETSRPRAKTEFSSESWPQEPLGK